MKALFFLLASLLFFNVYAENVKIGYVNIDEVIEKSPLYNSANNQLFKEFEPRKKQLLSLYDEIDKLRSKILLPNDIDDDIVYHNNIKKIQLLQAEITEKSDQWQQDLNEKQINLLNEIELKINIAINDFALSNNYDLILYENGAFVSTEVDITQEIINLIELHSP